MPINSNKKGKRGELEWAKILSGKGFASRRGQQFKGTPESPDVLGALDGLIHWEVKRQQNRQIQVWYDTAEAEAPAGAMAVLAHRRDKQDWICTTSLINLIKMLGWPPNHLQLYDGPARQIEAYLSDYDTGIGILHPHIHDKRSLHLDKYLRMGDKQAAKHQLPVVIHRRPIQGEMWLASMWAETFFEVMVPWAIERGVAPSELQES